MPCNMCRLSYFQQLRSMPCPCVILIQRHALRKLRKPGISISLVNAESSPKIVRNLTNKILQQSVRLNVCYLYHICHACFAYIFHCEFVRANKYIYFSYIFAQHQTATVSFTAISKVGLTRHRDKGHTLNIYFNIFNSLFFIFSRDIPRD